jgi:hypothetical protein
MTTRELPGCPSFSVLLVTLGRSICTDICTVRKQESRLAGMQNADLFIDKGWQNNYAGGIGAGACTMYCTWRWVREGMRAKEAVGQQRRVPRDERGDALDDRRQGRGCCGGCLAPVAGPVGALRPGR